MSIYLGLDSSTQSVTATAIEVDDAHPDRRSILFERSFRYDDTLPAYGTQHGVLRSPDPHVVHAPPLMWSEGLDRIVSDVVARGGHRLAAAARHLGIGATAWQRLPQREGAARG